MPVETLTFDQVHLGVPDPVAGARWYADVLGASQGEHIDRVWFGAVRVIFLKNDAPGPSEGAAIDHFALSYADITAAAQMLAHAGVRVTTGTIPDYATEVKGLLLGGVTGGGPAEQAGLMKGDIIVEIAGQGIANIYDYTYALELLRVNQPVKVVYLRNGERRETMLTPAARR